MIGLNSVPFKRTKAQSHITSGFAKKNIMVETPNFALDTFEENGHIT